MPALRCASTTARNAASSCAAASRRRACWSRAPLPLRPAALSDLTLAPSAHPPARPSAPPPLPAAGRGRAAAARRVRRQHRVRRAALRRPHPIVAEQGESRLRRLDVRHRRRECGPRGAQPALVGAVEAPGARDPARQRQQPRPAAAQHQKVSQVTRVVAGARL